MYFLRRSILRPIAAACVLLLGILPANGIAALANNNDEPRPGSIQGTLTTTQDSATGLSGLTLRLSHGASTENLVTAETDDSGHFEFKNLRPGSYAISLNQPGFKSFTKSINIEPGQTVELNLQLELETVAEKVEVNEDTQSIATESASVPAETVTQQQMEALPTAQEKIREVLPVTPGVVKTQDGKLNFKGADENQSMMVVNSARTADPAQPAPEGHPHR